MSLRMLEVSPLRKNEMVSLFPMVYPAGEVHLAIF